MDLVGRLTDRQIREVYFRARLGKDDDVRAPETEDDIREWAAAIMGWRGVPSEKAEPWIEQQVEKWRAEQNGGT